MSKKYIPSPKIIVGIIQMNSNESVEENLATVSNLIQNAEKCPEVIVFPEMFNYRKQSFSGTHYAESSGGLTMKWLKEEARKHSVWILAGSIAEKSEQEGKAYNTCFVVNPQGEIIEKYRKIHLFDVTLNDKKIQESNRFLPGKSPVIIDINGWKFGLAICYDLRFPELFQYYFKNKVDAIILPSSFTYETGEKHWHVLCRARAIENQCYFIAPNQYGIGAGSKETYGHSLIADPYGKVISEIKSPTTKIQNCELFYETITTFRSEIPIINHKSSQLNNQ